jgi:membrane-associated phospholipid phosphatase
MLKDRHGRGLTIGLATLLILLVGFSRIALGAHYLSDVLGGIVLGIFWLMLCFWLSTSIRRRGVSISLLGTRRSPLPVDLAPPARQII